MTRLVSQCSDDCKNDGRVGGRDLKSIIFRMVTLRGSDDDGLQGISVEVFGVMLHAMRQGEGREEVPATLKGAQWLFPYSRGAAENRRSF